MQEILQEIERFLENSTTKADLRYLSQALDEMRQAADTKLAYMRTGQKKFDDAYYRHIEESYENAKDVGVGDFT